jgi:hypothetical protein
MFDVSDSHNQSRSKETGRLPWKAIAARSSIPIERVNSMSIAETNIEPSAPGAVAALIGLLAGDDQRARALIHLLCLIDSTSDDERHLVINTAIEQAYAHTDRSQPLEAILNEIRGREGARCQRQ